MKNAREIKLSEDLNEFSQILNKVIVKAAVNTEMNKYLGYEKM